MQICKCASGQYAAVDTCFRTVRRTPREPAPTKQQVSAHKVVAIVFVSISTGNAYRRFIRRWKSSQPGRFAPVHSTSASAAVRGHIFALRHS